MAATKQKFKKSNVPSLEQCEFVSQILKNMAHPQRLLILCHLCEAPKSVSELEELSGASQSAVSQFLTRMKQDGLVRGQRKNQNVIYDIESQQVKKLVSSMHKIFRD
ncbi:MAG: transcriptional regulator [Bdellovibrionales bacterium CG10_big_fil_rev_8_21_14_0_10_45_34]|nr:MAG: transcriptional regulator [Bdellovibrionales bacterium CG10_big_fil_rev_8_21_14_0_10_45_34]